MTSVISDAWAHGSLRVQRAVLVTGLLETRLVAGSGGTDHDLTAAPLRA